MKRGKRVRVALAAAIALQLALIAGYLLLREEPSPTSFGLEEPSPEVGPLAWEAPDGATEDLAGLRGEPVVVHVWATWCGPCREELPELLAFAADSPVRVVALSVDRDWDTIRRFLGGVVPEPVARAPAEEVTRALGTRNLPETWIIDADGHARALLRGPGDWDDEGLREVVVEIARH